MLTRKWVVSLAAMAGLQIAAMASAAVIINAAAGDRAINDSNHDNLGDARVGATSAAYQLGESNTDASENRIWIPFVLTTEQRTAIGSSTSVSLGLSLSSLGSVSAFSVDVYGIADRSSTLPAVTDFEAAATLLADNAFTSTSSPGYSSFDVSSFVQTEAARSATSVIVFRLQLDPNTLPNSDGAWNRYIIAMSESATPPQLTVIVPEPTLAAGLFGLGGLLMCRRQSARR